MKANERECPFCGEHIRTTNEGKFHMCLHVFLKHLRQSGPLSYHRSCWCGEEMSAAIHFKDHIQQSGETLTEHFVLHAMREL